MKDTSLHAWFHTVLPTLPTRKAQVLAIVERYQESGITMRETSKVLDKPVHTISGCFTHLEKDGKIKVKQENGRNCVKYFGPESQKGRQPHNLYVPC